MFSTLAHGGYGELFWLLPIVFGFPAWLSPAITFLAKSAQRRGEGYFSKWVWWVAGYYAGLGTLFGMRILLPLAMLWVLGGIVLTVLLFQRGKKLTAGKCPTCGYDLRVHKAGEKCPECGTIILNKDDTISGERSRS